MAALIARLSSFFLSRDEIIDLSKFKQDCKSFCNHFLYKLRKPLTELLLCHVTDTLTLWDVFYFF